MRTESAFREEKNMEEKKSVHNNDLKKVTGGIINDVIFYGSVPICPVCGERPIKKITEGEYDDVYKCQNCGCESVHKKKLRPEEEKHHTALTCPRCGSIGTWRILSSANGIDTVECKVCRLSMTTPSEVK